MPINILMPALSPTMEKGNLAKWLKREGDKVKSGDVIAEIETDKATMEVEAVDEGTISKIVVPAGTADVPVNQVIAVLAGQGGDAKAAGAASAERGPRIRLAAREAARQRIRDRRVPCPRFRPARPRHCARYRRGEIRQGPQGRTGCCPGSAGSVHRTIDVGSAGPRTVR